MVNLPTVSQERDRIGRVSEAVRATLAGLTAAELRQPNPASWWFQENRERVRADAFVRAICHTHAHVRQIGLLRRLQGLSDAAGWPQEHWA